MSVKNQFFMVKSWNTCNPNR